MCKAAVFFTVIITLLFSMAHQLGRPNLVALLMAWTSVVSITCIGGKGKSDQLASGIGLHVDLEVFVGVSAQVEGGWLNHQVRQEAGLDHVKEGHEVEVVDKGLGQSQVELDKVEDGGKAASALAHHVQLLSLDQHLLAQLELLGQSHKLLEFISPLRDHVQGDYLLLTLHPAKLNLCPNLGGQVLGHHGVQVPGKCGPSHKVVGLHVKGK